jgi:hypothetical protein
MTLKISDIQHNNTLRYAECGYAEGGIYLLLYCHYAECCYAECCKLSVVMLSVIMLSLLIALKVGRSFTKSPVPAQ